MRGHIGEILIGLGDPAAALDELQRSIRALERLPGARDARLDVGAAIANVQFWLGEAHMLLVSPRVPASERNVDHCREARSWFERCLPAFERLRDGAAAGVDAAGRIARIRQEVSRCESP